MKMEKLETVLEKTKNIIKNNKSKIVGSTIVVGSVAVSAYLYKLHISDSETIKKQNTIINTLIEENKELVTKNEKLFETLNVADEVNFNLMQRIDQLVDLIKTKDSVFKKVISDGTRCHSSEAARQMGYLSQATRQMKAQA